MPHAMDQPLMAYHYQILLYKEEKTSCTSFAAKYIPRIDCIQGCKFIEKINANFKCHEMIPISRNSLSLRILRRCCQVSK